MQNKNIVIIGSGPAGISASIYLKRAGLNPIILEKSMPGGTLNETKRLENYPGYLDLDGSLLAEKMYEQITNLDIIYKTEKVIDIKKYNDEFVVETLKNKYNANYILIATGKTPRKLYIQDSDKYIGKGLSYCATCDGALYKNKDVLVVGGGNTALETAIYLSNIANNVYVINRSNLRADLKVQNDIKKIDNIKVILNTKITEIISDDIRINKVRLDNNEEISISGIFVCIGQEANNGYYQNLNIDTDNMGIIVDKNMKTNIDGIYAAGDSVSKDLYQVVTAVSEGAIAATSIIKDIRS